MGCVSMVNVGVAMAAGNQRAVLRCAALCHI
jgi:hypothetical protein